MPETVRVPNFRFCGLARTIDVLPRHDRAFDDDFADLSGSKRKRIIPNGNRLVGNRNDSRLQAANRRSDADACAGQRFGAGF